MPSIDSIFTELDCSIVGIISKLKTKSVFKEKFDDIINILCVLKMPISSYILSKLCNIEEKSLMAGIK